MEATEQMSKYFENIEKEVWKIHDIAKKAREKSYDPEQKVDIPLAKGIGQRVE